ncbi:MAG: metallopeptidase family protein [Candidatus Latescibacteria bacterium]|nr:metallopeptidase family protein [Candidatus Latescibacterota bacterium]
MTRKQFEKFVLEALEELPEEFRKRLDSVEIVIEDEPTVEDLESVGLTEDDLLLGLYHGTPLTERTSDYNMALPDRIVLFQWDIEQCCETPEEIAEEVRKTVIHEVAHFFGFGEDEIPF